MDAKREINETCDAEQSVAPQPMTDRPYLERHKYMAFGISFALGLIASLFYL